MATPNKMTKEMVEIAVHLFEVGNTQQTIAEKIGVSKTTINTHLKRAGVLITKAKNGRSLIAKTDREEKNSNLRMTEQIRLTAGCIDCGYNFHPKALHFDHRDRGTKKFSIGSCLRLSKKTLLEEIMKCDVRCANCHSIRTAGQFGY